jgi:VanZ family protein
LIRHVPQDEKGRIPASFVWITVAVVMVIVYGSLYPFVFQSRSGSPWRALAAVNRLRDSRGDILANILLYLPFGFFAIQALRCRAVVRQVAAVTLAGLILSTGMELLQFYVPGRDSSLTDIGFNTLGSFLGAGAGMLLCGKFGPDFLQPIRKHRSSALILACWLGYRLFPYVPAIDLHKYWHAVRPLLVAPVLPPLDLYRHTVVWLVLALVLEDLCDAPWKRIAFPLLVPLLLCCRIAIVDAILSPAEVAGAAIAVFGWIGFLARLPVRPLLIFCLFVILVILQALEPFRFAAAARPFTWVPFHGFLHGSTAVNVQSFLEKTFLYGSLVWLAMRVGFRWWMAMLACGGLVFGLRLVQVYIPGRSAEISDVIILLMVGGVIGLLDRPA